MFREKVHVFRKKNLSGGVGMFRILNFPKKFEYCRQTKLRGTTLANFTNVALTYAVLNKDNYIY